MHSPTPLTQTGNSMSAALAGSRPGTSIWVRAHSTSWAHMPPTRIRGYAIQCDHGSLLRLVGKCLHVGVPGGAEITEPETGTAEGSVLSPVLGNVYLHHVLDLWFEREVKPRLRGKATLIRYCDDFLIGFEREDDARRVQAVLGRRMERFGLTLHPEKTRLLAFRKPAAGSSKGPGTFDFLGFTFYWKRTRSGRWAMACKTRSASLRRAIVSVYDWCQRYRHQPVKVQHAALCRRIQGHFNYFGVSGNFRSLLLVLQQTAGASAMIRGHCEQPARGATRSLEKCSPQQRRTRSPRLWSGRG